MNHERSALKSDRLARLRELVTKPIVVGGTSTGFNLCDMYLNLRDRAAVLW